MYHNSATIIFEGSLQDFTGEGQIEKSFHLNPSAKDLVESCGVPHVEVFGLEVNEKSEPLDYNVKDGDWLTVIPKEIICDADSGYRDNIRAVERLPAWFIADVHLGKLAQLLRLTGMDTVYSNSADDADIVDTAVQENRAVLTRDVGLLKFGKLSYGYWLRSADPNEQLTEVIRYFNLSGKFKPFTRCMNCNGQLTSVDKTEVESKLPPKVKESFKEFSQCSECKKVYWKGSHYDKLVKKVRELEIKG